MEENKNSLLVLEIDPESDNIRAALGITKERGDILVKIFNDNCKKRPLSLSRTIAIVSESCIHANELAWICFIGGINQRAHDNADDIMKMLFGKK